MADSGAQSPLGINVLGYFLNNSGLAINPVAASYMGESKTNTKYTFGSLVSSTVLQNLTWAINDGYNRGPGDSNATLTDTVYDNLISIGSGTIPALGNSKPPTYLAEDPAGVWTNTAQAIAGQNGVSPAMPAPATSGYALSYSNIDQGQDASWLPYDTTNPNSSVTQWGYTRLHALQAWNEFNWNGTSVEQNTPQYQEFCSSFLTASGAIATANQTITAAANSKTFLQGVYSNMNDLISADITGVNLSTINFGTDLINLGNAIDLSHIATFGLPSNLLRTLANNSAITQDLNLALLAAGLDTNDITNIVEGTVTNITTQQEQQIYGAFLIIAGANLQSILGSLKCNTQGLVILADLLNVQKMFPLSYQSMTVPVYNAQVGLPTNSKTYYLIFSGQGVNPAIDSPAIQSYVGTIIPSGTPAVYPNTQDPANYSQLPMGFSSYLYGILPYDQALAAGAFSYAMQQIHCISTFDFPSFAKVVQGIETTVNLPLVAGTDKPTDQAATNKILSTMALGSGPNGQFTYSDFFGCMSGLPYPWQLIQQRLINLQTANLQNIYDNLFLAVTWEPATAEMEYTTYTGPAPDYLTYYHITGVRITNPGGGYGRGNAPPPQVIISSGGTAKVTIGTDDTTAMSVGNGSYGRVQSIQLIDTGPDGIILPTITIECPPISLSGDSNSPAGTQGWPAMNTVVQGYIDQANAEIQNIQGNNPDDSTYLNQYWNICGSQLKREQRSRYTYLAPVQIPKSFFASQYPSTINTFVNSMPAYSQDTVPNGAGQTIEAISDMNSVGGQSSVAMGRQERNQARLNNIGINPDNNIPNTLSAGDQKTLITNGTLSGALEGIPACGNQYTIPAWPTNMTMSPCVLGTYDPALGFQSKAAFVPGDINQILDCFPNPVANPMIPVGPVEIPNSPIANTVLIAPPANYDPTNLPPNLDPNFTNSTMFCAKSNVPEAINHVINCNCDCWIG